MFSTVEALVEFDKIAKAKIQQLILADLTELKRLADVELDREVIVEFTWSPGSDSESGWGSPEIDFNDKGAYLGVDDLSEKIIQLSDDLRENYDDALNQIDPDYDFSVTIFAGQREL